MAVPDSFGWTLFVALACCFMRSPLVFGSDHVHTRSLYTGSCSCKTSTTVLTCTAQPTVCKDAEYEIGESCYVLFDSPKAQDEAQQVCQTVPGGHLVYIESQDEHELERSLSSIIPDNDEYWIGLMVQHVWLDGSTATYQAFDDESHDSGGECFRMYPYSDFKWNDKSCGNRYAYVCERELMVPEMQDIAGETCQTPVSSLNGLLESGALCVREAGLYPEEYFLCPCGKEKCIKGCGCSRPNSGSPVMCNCGLCNLTFTGNTADVDTYMGSVYKEWQVLSSTFLCKCNDATTAEAAEYYRFEDGAFSSLNSTCEGTANTSGAVAGAVVAVVILLVIIVAIVIVVYRKGGKKFLSERKKRVSKQSGTTTADNTGGNRRYENNLPSGAHQNPAFAASLDSPGQDEEYTYIAPTNAEAGQQSDKPPGKAGGAAGTPSAQGLPRQPPPAVAPYRPTPKTGDTSYTDLEKARVDRGPKNAPAPDQGYTSLTQPSESLDDIDSGYLVLNADDPAVDLPSYPEYDPYNHLKFTN